VVEWFVEAEVVVIAEPVVLLVGQWMVVVGQIVEVVAIPSFPTWFSTWILVEVEVEDLDLELVEVVEEASFLLDHLVVDLDQIVDHLDLVEVA